MANDYLDKINVQARKDFLKLTAEQDRQVMQAYKTAGADLVKKYRKTTEGSASRAYYASYIRSLDKELNDIILKNGFNIAHQSAEMHMLMMEKTFATAGIDNTIVQNFDRIYGKVPYKAMSKIIDGEIYQDGKGLSARIWGSAVQSGNDIQAVVLAGIAQQQSAIKMAKTLEAFVDPDVRKTWDRAKVREVLGDGYANWNKSAEYNALRLARTTLTHSSTLGQIESAKANPFVEGLQWHLSGSHSARMHGKTDICDSRNNQVYALKDVPFDHPNGLCYQTPFITKSLEDIGDDLHAWVNGGDSPTMTNWWAEHGGEVAGSQAVDKVLQASFKYSKKYNGPDADNYLTASYKPTNGGKPISVTINKNDQWILDMYGDAKTLEEKQQVSDFIADKVKNVYIDKKSIKELLNLEGYIQKINGETILYKNPIAKAMQSPKVPKQPKVPKFKDIKGKFMDFKTDRGAADKWGDDLYDAWRQKINWEEADAIENYTGSIYTEVNKYLRKGVVEQYKNGGWTEDALKNLADNAARGLQKFELPDNLIVYRGMGESAFDDMMELRDKIDAGGYVFRDKGFMSTSVVQDGAFSGRISMEIKVPKGYTGGAYVAPMSRVKGEKEFLISKDAALRFIKWEDLGYNQIKIYAEVIS